MNQPGGQAQPGAPPNAQAGGASAMLRPEVMQRIPGLTAEEKEKYTAGLGRFWEAYENNPEGSEKRREAEKKIREFTRSLSQKLRERKAQVLAQGQAAQNGQAQPQAQPVAQGQAPGAVANAQTASAPSNANEAGAAAPGAGAATAAAPQQPAAPTAMPEAIQRHLASITFQVPPAVLAEKGAEGAAKWLQDLKKRYAQSLMQMESSKNQINRLEQALKVREGQNRPLTADEQRGAAERKALFQKQHDEASRIARGIRSQQESLGKNPAGAGGAAVASAGGVGAGQARPQPTPQQPQQTKVNPPVPPHSLGQAPGQGQATNANASLQNSQANINGAFDAARKEQLAAGRVPATTGPASQVPQAAGQAPIGDAQIKSEPGIGPQPVAVPNAQPPHPQPINTAVAAAGRGIQPAGTPTQASARTPQTATPLNGAPRAYSQKEALEMANKRTASVSGAIPGQANHAGAPAGTPTGAAPAATGMIQQGHTHAHPNQPPQPLSGIKMPIPKVLPEKATQIPAPVSIGGGMSSGRPTMTQGGGVVGGVLGQPAVSKVPGYTTENEGERVLSKKKLDELVRQVCGGGPDDNQLSPEVEEIVLGMADSFVDQVLNGACLVAKERGSKVLEQRDIQFVLERTWNIRIPGYSSDELRTVRKVVPHHNWITKMSVVQAAKVTGKGDS